MSLKHKIAFNTLVQFAGRFFTSFLGFLTTVILARYLGSYNYGVYAKIYTLAAFFYLFVDFGLNAVYIRKHKDNLADLHQIFSLRTLFFLVSLALIVVFLSLSGNLIFTNQEKLWTLLFVPTILFFGYYTTLNIVFQLKLRYDLSVVASVVGALVGLILLIATIKWGIVFGIISVVFGYLVTVLAAWYFAKQTAVFSLRGMFKFRNPALKKMFQNALPIGTMLFLNTMYSRVDVFVLSAVRGDTAVGVYQLAYKFFEFPLAFALFFANAVFPHYIKMYAESRPHFWRIFKRATFWLFLASLVFTVGGLIIAPFLGLIKNDYVASAAPLQILVLSYPVFFLTSAFSWLLFVQHQEKRLIFIYGLSFVLNLAANIILVPKFSYFASSWITVLGEIIVLVYLVYLVKKTST